MRIIVGIITDYNQVLEVASDVAPNKLPPDIDRQDPSKERPGAVFGGLESKFHPRLDSIIWLCDILTNRNHISL
jgi:hypothetical protein